MVIIENNTRFSESCLWKAQKDYFDQSGINAWVNQVPFYITSNPFIAECYAQLAIHFVRDWINKYPDSKNHPFYILELGTGSGRFSYYVLKTLHEQRKALEMDVEICYIMSDFTKSNLHYYESHPAFASYLKEGLVDFAIFDLEIDKPITLFNKNITLDNKILVNPLTVFANYIFDTVSHDAFTIQQGKLHELLLKVSTDKNNIHNNLPKDMEKTSIEYILREINHPYYADEHLNHILEQYKKELTQSSFLFPIGAIRAMNYLRKIANNKLFLIVSDKGYNSVQSLDHLNHPALSFHGSFSMMVNFHALSEYFRMTGGDAYLQTPRKGIKTSVFCSGFPLNDLIETCLVIQEKIEDFSPADYFTLHRRMSDSIDECDLPTLAAHLNLSKWDPHIFQKCAKHIQSLVTKNDKETISFLADNMTKLAANYYYMPKSDCVLFEIGIFFHSIKRYSEALHYYQEAERYIGAQFSLFYNTALCFHAMDKLADAIKNFQRALELNPDSKEATEWLAYLNA